MHEKACGLPFDTMIEAGAGKESKIDDLQGQGGGDEGIRTLETLSGLHP